MSIQVTCYADQQIILSRMSAPLDPVADPLAVTQRVAECMAEIQGYPIYRIFDLSSLTLSFGEMVFTLAVETRNTPGTFYDLRVIHLVITLDQEIREAIEALQYPSIYIVESMEDACRYITQHRQVGNTQNEGPPAPPHPAIQPTNDKHLRLS